MFTGIIEGIGRVAIIRRVKGQLHLTIKPDFPIRRYQIGESVAVDGVCLTVVAFNRQSFTASLGVETQKLTTLGRRKKGDRLNLERPVRFSDRLGGHLVQGHVDAVGKITKIRKGVEGTELSIFFPQRLKKYVVPKGSIAVDGVSLTVNRLQGSSFSVFLLPHTLEMTTLGMKKARNSINLEIDIIGKYVENFVKS